jgi:benzoyl-CoA reductase subunit D
VIAAGIDVGAKTTKAILMDGDAILGRGAVPTGFDQDQAACQALGVARQEAALEESSIKKVFFTGLAGRSFASAAGHISSVRAAARGTIHLLPEARTIIDVGAEQSYSLSCDAHGAVLDFALNERCAAGSGAFLEAMSHALEVTLQELDALAGKASGKVRITAQCTIFAESEVVSLIHSQTPKPDIAGAIIDSIASRVAATVRGMGSTPLVVLIGGLARCAAFRTGLQSSLEMDVQIPENPEFACALGAALIAMEEQ